MAMENRKRGLKRNQRRSRRQKRKLSRTKLAEMKIPASFICMAGYKPAKICEAKNLTTSTTKMPNILPQGDVVLICLRLPQQQCPDCLSYPRRTGQDCYYPVTRL